MSDKSATLEQIRAVTAEQSKVLAPLTNVLPARRNRPRLAWFRHSCVPARRPDQARPFGSLDSGHFPRTLGACPDIAGFRALPKIV